jgi:hypothetical protein
MVPAFRCHFKSLAISYEPDVPSTMQTAGVKLSLRRPMLPLRVPLQIVRQAKY